MTDAGLENAAARALELVADGMRVGLGTGRAASVFLARLAERVGGGLRIVGVPTSEATAALARSLRIPLGALDDEEDKLALTVDGADEVTPNLDLVKGFGGALVRERIIAAASHRQIILAGSDKLVDRLGMRGRIPIEVVPFAWWLVLRRVRELGLDPVIRLADGRPFMSDNGNLTVDCRLRTPLADARAARTVDADLRAIPGVVDTGLFLGTAERVLIGHPDGRVDVLQAEG
ncbi:MAG TPA: ribose-5-phosphate isomerase RpiA [Candidatus Binatia bacterium]|nr:ribose-5-phosphate isomerase RpiA [Candidatus Binatia bacterium]